jgi:hypothetical protein
MTKIENLASELAFLSNDSLYQLAGILLQDYPTRVDAFETAIRSVAQEAMTESL